MQVTIKRLMMAILFLMPFVGLAQSAYLSESSAYLPWLDRMEIKLQRNPDLNALTARPLSRKVAVRVGSYADSVMKQDPGFFSRVDRYRLNSLYKDNPEWIPSDSLVFPSRHSLFKTFYKTPAHFFEVKEKDFFLSVNPVLQYRIASEQGNSERLYVNTRGTAIRGLIARRLGFSVLLLENQERGPRFFKDRVNEFQAVPGVGFYKSFKQTGYDYFDGRGSINFTAARYLDLQFGYDKNFIGSGYRSLLLSNFGNSYLFFKVNTRIWKLNYLNLFMELTPQFNRGGGDRLLDKKYAVMHHLSLNVTKWMNVGFFEAVLFGRRNHFDFTYLNPVIFLRPAEQQNGSADNAFVGIDLKMNMARHIQWYGQLLFDEFVLKEVRSRSGWWANKYAVQLGMKYVDVLGVRNLDLQGELNMIRPFTYTHHDSLTNYTHYNQPLAHPMGANLAEGIGVLRYQPHPRWTVSAKAVYWRQGRDALDSASSNVGTNIFKMNYTRSLGDFGYQIGSGIDQKGLNLQLLLSFEWKENLFLELSQQWRKVSGSALAYQSPDARIFSVGLRWNIWRREYDY